MKYTQQIRNIMRSFNANVIYTNKYPNINARHVKCYFREIAPYEMQLISAVCDLHPKITMHFTENAMIVHVPFSIQN